LLKTALFFDLWPTFVLCKGSPLRNFSFSLYGRKFQISSLSFLFFSQSVKINISFTRLPKKKIKPKPLGYKVTSSSSWDNAGLGNRLLQFWKKNTNT
jgi:hypothetical protein